MADPANYEQLKPLSGEHLIALAGNPNVGKSTVFNALTGLRQHTGNWAGKTVACAAGRFISGERRYLLADLPGVYSLTPRSYEEQAALDFLCNGGAEAVCVVCDAGCLERGLALVLQLIELNPRTLVCVNLMDEAQRRGLNPDLPLISERLGLPVVGVTARKPETLAALTAALGELLDAEAPTPAQINYAPDLEAAVNTLLPAVQRCSNGTLPARWLALRLLEGRRELPGLTPDTELETALNTALAALSKDEPPAERIAASIVLKAEALCAGAVNSPRDSDKRDRRLDRVLTSRIFGYPLMLALLALLFWLTVSGANYPSELLARLLFGVQDALTALFTRLGAPDWLHGALVLGVYRTLAWVISVMLPPMAIFFPLFTLLEDAGYLPRVAYNLDCPLKKCSACGKQALTMCMGLGCNAVGVTGCRIIDSPRERLLAILTNSFMPCNGRFPALITLLGLFFAGGSAIYSALGLTALIVLCVGVTLLTTRLLSATVLRGVPSAFALELPPYRLPQLIPVILRSVLDRTLFVLGRAAAVAAPAGLFIWLLANVSVGGASLMSHAAQLLSPIARLMGLDGFILLAFILGLPANEIVLPIVLMAYMAEGSLPDAGSAESIRAILTANGWTWQTAGSFILFSLMHWPCSTTLLTIKRETGSLKWTLLSALLPSAIGCAVCVIFTAIAA